MSRVALLCGVEAVNDKAYFEEHVKKICDTREKTKKALAALGFSFPDSQSNFIFAAHKSMPAKEILTALKERNIFVRYFNKPGIDNYLRITIGTDEQMQALEAALKEICRRHKEYVIIQSHANKLSECLHSDRIAIFMAR